MSYNVTRIILLHILIWSGVYSLDLIPTWSYWLIVAPAILYHAWYTRNIVEERFGEKEEEDRDMGVLAAEEIVVDEEFDEKIRLRCGGYARLEGWREEVVDTDDIRNIRPKLEWDRDSEEYEKLRVGEK